jgi:hypothetical protein
MANPYGWVSDKRRWQLLVKAKGPLNKTPTTTVWYDPISLWLKLPVGAWTDFGYYAEPRGATAAGGVYLNQSITLSTTGTSVTNDETTSFTGSDLPIANVSRTDAITHNQ